MADGADDSNYNPDVMKYITPYNFFNVRWPEFQGIVQEVRGLWVGGGSMCTNDFVFLFIVADKARAKGNT